MGMKIAVWKIWCFLPGDKKSESTRQVLFVCRSFAWDRKKWTNREFYYPVLQWKWNRIAVFDDIDDVTNYARNALINACGKVFSNLDAFKQIGGDYITQELMTRWNVIGDYVRFNVWKRIVDQSQRYLFEQIGLKIWISQAFPLLMP